MSALWYNGTSPEGYADWLAWAAGEVDNEPEYDEAGQPIVDEPEQRFVSE